MLQHFQYLLCDWNVTKCCPYICIYLVLWHGMQCPPSLPLTFWPSSHPTYINYIHVSEIPPPSHYFFCHAPVCVSLCSCMCVANKSGKPTLYYVYVLTRLLLFRRDCKQRRLLQPDSTANRPWARHTGQRHHSEP